MVSISSCVRSSSLIHLRQAYIFIGSHLFAIYCQQNGWFDWTFAEVDSVETSIANIIHFIMTKAHYFCTAVPRECVTVSQENNNNFSRNYRKKIELKKGFCWNRRWLAHIIAFLRINRNEKVFAIVTVIDIASFYVYALSSFIFSVIGFSFLSLIDPGYRTMFLQVHANSYHWIAE